MYVSPVERFLLGVGAELLEEQLVLVPLRVVDAEEVELVLAAPRSGGHASHDEVDVRHLSIIHPVDPGDLRPIPGLIAVPTIAIEEDPRSADVLQSRGRLWSEEREEGRDAEADV